MGTGRTDNKAPITRPKKGTSERTRRVNTHKKRLSALGVSDEALVHLNPKEMRELLRKPALLKTA